MIIVIIVICIFIILIYFPFIKSNKIYKDSKSIKDNKLKQISYYEELLQDPLWKEKRDLILKRDNYCCKWCGSPYNLQVHHKYYLKYPNNQPVKPWSYSNDALITLCDKHHSWYHSKHKIKWYYTKW